MPHSNGLKICFFNTTRAWGGGEKWHLDMAVRLKGMGHDVLFVANEGSALAERLGKTSVPTTTMSIGRLSFLNPFKVHRLRRLFEREGVSVLVMNLPSDLKAAGWAAKRAGVGRIVYRRGSAVPVRDSPSNRYIFKKLLTDVIANSEATKRTILERNPGLFPRDRIKVIYNGLDLERRSAAPARRLYTPAPGEIVLGNAGRMVFQKGHDLLLDVAGRLKAAGVQFKLLLAGSGPLEGEIRERIRRQGLGEQVILLGFVDDVASFMRSIDVFLLSSRWEGFGFVLAEAMAAGKPIVAFDVSSNPELVEHGVNGLLAAPFDTQAFADHVLTLVADAGLRERLGNEGLARVRAKFSFERVVQELLELISPPGAGGAKA